MLRLFLPALGERQWGENIEKAALCQRCRLPEKFLMVYGIAYPMMAMSHPNHPVAFLIVYGICRLKIAC
jgi:hypothetical protein